MPPGIAGRQGRLRNTCGGITLAGLGFTTAAESAVPPKAAQTQAASGGQVFGRYGGGVKPRVIVLVLR